MLGPTMLALISIVCTVANPSFDQAKQLHQRGELARAIEQLKVARQVPGQSEAEQVAVLELLARCLSAQGRQAEAQGAYEELLVVEPSFAPDRSPSPELLEAFDSAKEKVFPNGYVKLEPLPSPLARVRLKVIDPWQRASTFELGLRVHPDQAWITTVLTPEAGALTVELAGAPLCVLEWYVNVLDAGGAVVAQYGSREAPQRHTVPAATVVAAVVRETPRFQRWPAWVSVGIGVAATLVGAVFQVNANSRARLLDDRSMPPGDWADTARAQHQLATRDATIATALFLVGGAATGVGALVFAW